MRVAVAGGTGLIGRLVVRELSAGGHEPADVAAALVGYAGGPPAGLAQDLAGPECLRMVDMARRIVRARGSRRLVVPLRLPGRAGTEMARGGLLPTGDYTETARTFDDYLADLRTSAGGR